jgi:hypothetical protein
VLDEVSAIVMQTYGRTAELCISQPWSPTAPWVATIRSNGTVPVKKTGPSLKNTLEQLTTHCVLMGWR